jgi:hypothetical protein
VVLNPHLTHAPYNCIILIVVALFNAVAKAKRDASLEEDIKKKKSAQIADSNALILKDHNSQNNKEKSKSSAPQENKSWKAVSDDQIPLVSPCLCYTSTYQFITFLSNRIGIKMNLTIKM